MLNLANNNDFFKNIYQILCLCVFVLSLPKAMCKKQACTYASKDPLLKQLLVQGLKGLGQLHACSIQHQSASLSASFDSFLYSCLVG